MPKNSTSTLNEVVRLHIKKVEQNENEKGELNLFANVTSQEYHQKLKIKIDESELVRILKHLNPDNNNTDGSTFAFVQDLLILKVGGSYNKYSDFANAADDNIGKLILNIINDEGKILDVKTFKRKICASGHNRSQKVMFVSQNIYDKLDKILLCGLDTNARVVPSKFNSYDGLVATDSKPVTMPKIVVVDDYKTVVHGKYDVVTMTSKDEKSKAKTVTKHIYSVKSDKERSVEILPFDGAGLVSVNCAQKWAKELDKNYIPASFQFRCLAGLKGNLFTYDIDEFSSIYGSKIIDIWGKTWDIVDDRIDAILTKSQFKFWGLYQDKTKDYGGWLEAFNTDIHGYKRTFNISEVAEECKHLKNHALMSYQPLQTLNLSDREVDLLCSPTVNKIESIHNDVEAFLQYRNIKEFECEDSGDEPDTCQEWNFMQPYYQAMLYNHSLFNDEYIKGKVKRDIKTIIRKACMGKIHVKGNYQTLAPDLYGLAQYAFSQEVTGLIGKDEIYSNFWDNQYDKVSDMENNQTAITNAETGVDQTDTATVTDTTTDAQTTGEMLTMPKADYDKALQSAEDKIRSAKTKEIKALQAKIAELAPIEKTEADIALEKRLAKLEERETAAAEKERMINVQAALAAKGLDKSLADYLKSEVDVEAFTSLIDGIINERAKSNAYVPTGHQNNVGMTTEQWKNMSYSAKENFASSNPDIAKMLIKK